MSMGLDMKKQGMHRALTVLDLRIVKAIKCISDIDMNISV